jgi:hypothetical protein
MGKKCIVCSDPAKYKIKGTSDYYCEECAIEHFSDVDLLEKVEKEAQILKKLIKEKIGEDPVEENEQLNDNYIEE